MRPLTVLDGPAAGLPLVNIDTDLILAARYMKTTSRQGLGRYLFHALRFDDMGQERSDFVLNQPPWSRACFLVTLDNFGCGSSREHAPWALLDFGFRCIVAPSFGDIFATNCTKNGILPLSLPRDVCERLISDLADPDRARLKLDLPNQLLLLPDDTRVGFEVSAEWKQRLVEGLDDVQRSLGLKSAIEQHEAKIEYPHPFVPSGIGSLIVTGRTPGAKGSLIRR